MQSIASQLRNPSAFSGAKLFLFLGSKLVVILRDNKPDIPFPDHWDLPGGGRDGAESPIDCVLRETEEEVGLSLSSDYLVWARSYGQGAFISWMFAAHLPAIRADDLKLGEEGQDMSLMTPQTYATHPRAIPHFAHRLGAYLAERNEGFLKAPR